MKSKWLDLTMLLLVLGTAELCEGCLEEERAALTRLKPFFPFIDYYTVEGEYYDSAEEKQSILPYCCKWKRVECDPISGRITHLFLDRAHSFDGRWYLNASLFLPFEELQLLSLSYNSIAGCIADQGFERLSSRLNKLETLDLSFNLFNDSILTSISKLSSLRFLDLSGSFESNGLKMLPKFNNLKTLNLSWNNLGNNILYKIHGFNSLKSLRLEGCGINGTVNLSDFSTLLNLKELYLDNNGINSLTSSFQDLRLMNLSVLDLRNNPLDSRIFSYLGRLSNLRTLFLGNPFPYGQLKDLKFNITEMDGLSKLEELYMYCGSGCIISLSSLDLFPSLKTLSLTGFELKEPKLYSHSQNIPLQLKKLETMSMYRSSFGNNFIQMIGVMPSLKTLNLSECGLNGTLHDQVLLQSKKLETFKMYRSSLGNNFIQKFGAMPSLKILDLSECGLNGTLHSKGFCGFTNLQKLYASNNNLKGNLPECFSNFTSLESLDLSSNQFSGGVSILGTLISLKELRLSNNYFHIPSSLRPFFNLSELELFYVDNNIIYTESQIQYLAPRFQLKQISLTCYGDAGQVPRFLYHQRHLRFVDISNVNLTGEFPNWLLQNNTNLHALKLANNSLQGHFELSFPPLTYLSYLDISGNSISGNVPIDIGVKLPSLSYLNMSRNHFHGSISASIGDMNSLQDLDLSDNQLSGELPEHLVTGCSSLLSLTLSNNRLQGQLFSSNFNLTELRELRLNGNYFSGKIPDSLSNCSRLSTLDVSNNKLVGGIPRWMENMSLLSTLDLSNNEISGKVPRWMGSMWSLQEIVMARNHLEGPFPEGFCNLYHLRLLDLSVNNISGHIPSCFSPFFLSQVHLSRNKLQGPLTDAFRNSYALVTLDLSHNNLTGKIPNWIDNLSRLSFLLLNNNQFEGRIPVQLCNLDQLSLIDLSNNNLSGTVPSCLKITTRNDISEEYVRYVARALNDSYSFSIDEPVEFTSKNKSNSYKGIVLAYLSGIDLSCNKLTGEIPRQVKNFQNIYALNLSHNSLIGPIPLTFSDLKQIESLDLSHNNLSGIIPSQLVELTSLAYFSVAYNNLSGSTLVMTAQFATFEESSYIGNPFLCGKPLTKTCTTSGPPPSSLPKGSTDKGLMDMTAFYASFVASYVVVILSIATVLYINPYWRRVWFYYIGEISKRCHYFLEDHILPKRFHCAN